MKSVSGRGRLPPLPPARTRSAPPTITAPVQVCWVQNLQTAKLGQKARCSYREPFSDDSDARACGEHWKWIGVVALGSHEIRGSVKSRNVRVAPEVLAVCEPGSKSHKRCSSCPSSRDSTS